MKEQMKIFLTIISFIILCITIPEQKVGAATCKAGDDILPHINSGEFTNKQWANYKKTVWITSTQIVACTNEIYQMRWVWSPREEVPTTDDEWGNGYGSNGWRDFHGIGKEYDEYPQGNYEEFKPDGNGGRSLGWFHAHPHFDDTDENAFKTVWLHIEVKDKEGNIGTASFSNWEKDTEEPVLTEFEIMPKTYAYVDGKRHWIQPGKTMDIRYKWKDEVSTTWDLYVGVIRKNEDILGNDIISGIESEDFNYQAKVRYDIGGELGREKNPGDPDFNDIFNEDVVYNDVKHKNSNGRYDTESESTFTVLFRGANYIYEPSYFLRDNAYGEVGWNLTTYEIATDGIAPTMTLSPSSRETWGKTPVTVDIDNDDIGSGVKFKGVKWSTSLARPSSFDDVNSTTMSTSGKWYLHYIAEDNVGNSTYGIGGPYLIDMIPPEGTLTPDTTEPTRIVVITAEGTDIHSGMKGITKVTGISGEPAGTFKPGSTATFPITENGTYVFEFQDRAGNTTYESIVIDNIMKCEDMRVPTMDCPTPINYRLPGDDAIAIPRTIEFSTRLNVTGISVGSGE